MVRFVTEADFRNSVYRNVVQIMVKGMGDSYRDMRTDPRTRYARSYSTHDDKVPTIGGSLVLGVVVAGLLVAASVPLLALAAGFGALVSVAATSVRRALAKRRPTPTATDPRRSRVRSLL
jgi:hypothetical protein